MLRKTQKTLDLRECEDQEEAMHSEIPPTMREAQSIDQDSRVGLTLLKLFLQETVVIHSLLHKKEKKCSKHVEQDSSQLIKFLKSELRRVSKEDIL